MAQQELDGVDTVNERRPIIYQANPLIEARKAMNTMEMRLFLIAL